MNLLNKDGVCSLLGISHATLNRIMARGEISYTKAGSRIRFTEADVQAYLERNKVPALVRYSGTGRSSQRRQYIPGMKVV